MVKDMIDIPKQKRILWLLNHTTLREGEVPMLQRMGFEVYVPKIFPFDEANQSASVTYEYDASLSIPKGLLQQMNQFDFYSRPWPKALAQEINQHFGAAVSAIFPKMVNALTSSFDGPILLRIFGLDGETTYAERFKGMLSEKAFTRIRRGDRIRMAANIATVIDHEPHWMRKNCLYLPVGLPADFYTYADQWQGDANRIFFVCPRINTSGYYNEIYQNFKKMFGDLPHIIAGAQPAKVDDPNVTGFLEQAKYIEIFKSSKVMYYHSTEERHIHYHPIEAVIYGLPLIFMSGGVLEFMAKKKLPGCCDTPDEARGKILRILRGDTTFTQEVLDSQKVLLREFSSAFVEETWQEEFPRFLRTFDEAPKTAQPQALVPAPVHIGIWMHETHPNGFTGEGISRLMAMIVRGAQEHPDLYIHIAAVSWVKQAIINYMEDLEIDTRRITFELVDERPPLIISLYTWWNNRKPRPRRPRLLLQRIRLFLRKIAAQIFESFALMRSPLGLLVVALLAVLASPLLLLVLVVMLFSMLKGFLTSFLDLFRTLSQKISSKTATLGGGRLARYLSLFSFRLPNFHTLASTLYNYISSAEMKQLARKLGPDKRFSGWFFAYPLNKHLHQFVSPTIVAAPDIVYMDFPTKYSQELGSALGRQFFFIKETIANADAVITFSEYVRENQMGKLPGQIKEKTTVIRHAPIETRSLISSRPGVDDDEIKLLARRTIKRYLRKRTQGRTDAESMYLHSLDLGELDYIFISSQSRLHKNHLNLLKAYRLLLREKYVNIKLVFTGGFSPDMEAYIKQERLHLDVLSMHYIPPVVHASFYACAKLTVVPTLFEGGFPFVFSESLSVNTPVVMSDIPVVQEILSNDERTLFCFDPYDMHTMAEKIMWALENRSALRESQQKTFERMKLRTWKDVAEEYLQIFTTTKKHT